MEHKQYLVLKSAEPMGWTRLKRLADELSEDNIECCEFSPDAYALKQAKELLKNKGASYVLSIEDLSEAVLPQASMDERLPLYRILNEFLANLAPQQNLTIIDPFFFAERQDLDQFMEGFQTVFEQFVTSVTHFTFITSSKINHNLYQRVAGYLNDLNERLTVAHHITSDFHDRFWIADQSKGIFVGTSLNGIGKKYSLADYMRDDDVTAVVEELRRRNFI